MSGQAFCCDVCSVIVLVCTRVISSVKLGFTGFPRKGQPALFSRGRLPSQWYERFYIVRDITSQLFSVLFVDIVGMLLVTAKLCTASFHVLAQALGSG